MPGKRFPELRVQMREIDITPSAKEPPVRAYDPSGPYTDPAVKIDIRAGLHALRTPWIKDRGDVEQCDPRTVRPEDNGLKPGEISDVPLFDRAGRKPLRHLVRTRPMHAALPA